MARVSIVIVSFNTKDQLRRCLGAIGDGFETIVVDNASSDRSGDMVEAEFPQVRLIRNVENVGFGPANNQGTDAASGDLVLYLNSDCYPESGSIQTLVAVFDNPGVVAAGGRLLNPDGSLQPSSANRLTLWAVFCEQTYLERLFPSSRFLSPYWNSERHEHAAEVEQVMGACLMIRKGLERFDERFFLYCEDTELCYRLRRHGKILYVPEAPFVHELGSSSGKMRWRAVALYNRGKELYFSIHHGWFAWAVCLKLNRLGALSRLLTWSVACLVTACSVGRIRAKAALFAQVLTAPLNGPGRPPRSGA